MLYSRAILLTMLLALAGAGSGVNAAPAHVCRDLVPRGADSQEARSPSQSPAPESSSKSTALGADSQKTRIQSSPPQDPIKAEAYYGRDFRRCGDLGHYCPGPSAEQRKLIEFFDRNQDIFRESEYKFLINIVDQVKNNPCSRQPEHLDDRDATKVLESYYQMFTAGVLKRYFDEKRDKKDAEYEYYKSWGTHQGKVCSLTTCLVRSL
ncbi:hypothetical protein C8R42DRAFT_109324 [Lentinula raphanica]|nr:hypothetical protein C8R42DRAFT_109324 [Lentinula raphanica]